MEKSRVDEISSYVVSYTATTSALYMTIENIVYAGIEMGLNKEERQEYALAALRAIDPNYVLEILTAVEEELLEVKKELESGSRNENIKSE